MAVILPPEYKFGDLLSEGLGTGLSNALAGLGQGLAKQSLSQRYQQGGLPGYLPYLPQEAQGMALKNFLSSQLLNEQRGVENVVNQIAEGREPLSPQNLLRGLAQESPSDIGTQGQQLRPPQLLKEEQPQARIEKTPEQKIQSQLSNIEKRLGDPSLSGALSSSLLAKREALENKLQQLSTTNNKETKETFNKIETEGRAAKKNNIRLEKMEELIKKGNLTNPAFASFLESLSKGIFGFGIDLFSLTNPDSEQFRKLSKDFLEEVKDVFGGRLNEFEVKSYLERIPSLSQSNEGKERLIESLRDFNNAALLKQKALREIIKENGGIRPLNLESKVDERVSTELDKLAGKFKESEEVPGTQTLLGSLLRVPPRLVGL